MASVKHAVRVLEYIDSRTADDSGPVPIALPALAAHITCDTKALNHGTTLATQTLRPLALRAGLHRPESAVGRRELWDLGNVIVDDLASRVLVLKDPVTLKAHRTLAVQDETRADTPDPNLTDIETAALAALSAEPDITCA